MPDYITIIASNLSGGIATIASTPRSGCSSSSAAAGGSSWLMCTCLLNKEQISQKSYTANITIAKWACTAKSWRRLCASRRSVNCFAPPRGAEGDGGSTITAQAKVSDPLRTILLGPAFAGRSRPGQYFDGLDLFWV